MIENFVHNNAFIECDTSQFLFIINNYLAYIIAFIIDFICFRYFMIKRVINNIDLEFDVIEI